MKILIAGGSGLIGSALKDSLVSDGHEVIILSRVAQNSNNRSLRYLKWDGKTTEGWGQVINEVDAVVNLAGENLSAGRWTVRRKQSILESRVKAGKALVEAIRQAAKKPAVFIQASGVGYYGTEKTGLLGEDAPAGDDYLAGVSREWEAGTVPVEELGVRRVVIRTAVVLSPRGGALERMLLPFRLFAGGPLGSGRQWLSWIHITDQVRAIRFLMDNPVAQGVFNLSAIPVTNGEFARVAGRVMKRPSFFRVPAFVLRQMLGEMSTMVLDGQRTSAEKLTRLGFTFLYPDLESALKHLVGK